MRAERPSRALRLAGPIGLAMVLLGCEDGTPPAHLRVVGGDVTRGAAALHAHGCASCHVIPGLRGGDVAWVGPPLTHWARRGYVAGRWPNTPEHLTAWLMDPQGRSPGTAMPNLGVTEAEARDMAAYLYRLGAAGAQAMPAGMPLAPDGGGTRAEARLRPR